MSQLPKEALVALAQVRSRKTKVLVCIPNILWNQAYMMEKIILMAKEDGYRIDYRNLTECRFQDYARNMIASIFLKSECEWLLQVDSDVDPHPKILDILKYDKPIIAASVPCFVKDNLVPSIWERAECEECGCLKQYVEKGTINDPRQYREYKVFGKRILERWNPHHERYEAFYAPDYGLAAPCRCEGTGKDPWAFKVARAAYTLKRPVRVDAVGGAATAVHRKVFETVPPPWYRFYYRENREIMLTEDLYFCWIAGKHGFETWADPQMQCEHYKTMGLQTVNRKMNEAYNAGRKETEKEVVPIA